MFLVILAIVDGIVAVAVATPAGAAVGALLVALLGDDCCASFSMSLSFEMDP